MSQAATLFLIRHAEHVHFNRRLSGRLPGIELSATGRAQAARLAERLAPLELAQVQCSPLARTRDTAATIAAAAGLPAPEPVAALIELDMGTWTGRAFDEVENDADWTAWNEHRATAHIPGGENMAEAQARIVAHLLASARRYEGKSIALVTHADLIRAAVAWALGLSLDKLLRFDIDPASITRMVVGDWGARLLSLNERDA